MIGAIAGDIVGSPYEIHPIKTREFPLFGPSCRFTDDTVLTVAVAEAILTGRSYLDAIRDFGRRYPNAGYGGTFIHWLLHPAPAPYNSWGNGSAMRVSPVGFAYETEADVLREAAGSAEITHNHPEGIKGAQAVALAVLLARTGAEKELIRAEISGRFRYNLDSSVDAIRPDYAFDVSCQGTVPAALIAFLDSASLEDAIRNAVSLGGDSDTLACIAGSIAEAFYGSVPPAIRQEVEHRLPPDLLDVTDRFCRRYGLV